MFFRRQSDVTEWCIGYGYALYSMTGDGIYKMQIV